MMTSSEPHKVAIITGDPWDWRAIVLAFAEAGFHVVFSYVSNQTAAQEVEVAAKAFGVDCVAVQSIRPKWPMRSLD